MTTPFPQVAAEPAENAWDQIFTVLTTLSRQIGDMARAEAIVAGATGRDEDAEQRQYWLGYAAGCADTQLGRTKHAVAVSAPQAVPAQRRGHLSLVPTPTAGGE